MGGKYTLVLGLHLLSTALTIKTIHFVLPFLATWMCACISTYVLWIFVAAISFPYTKEKFLNERVETENRAVFITGCDSGFGNALAERLDSRGFRVFASCLFPEGEGASKLKARCSSRLQILHLDVRQNKSVEEAVKYVKENLGTSELWSVVNNAGILKGFSVELSSMEDFQDVMDVNFFGTVRVTKAFLPLLKKSKGRIVNVTSLGGEVTIPFITPYLASKYAAVGFTDCLRHEISRQGISVVSIEPELFRTPLASQVTINKNLDSTLESSCNFGDDYEQSLKDLINVLLSLTSPNISCVVNDMESAVSLEHPDHTYKPRRHIWARFIFFCFEAMPRSFQILVGKCITFIAFSESKILKNIVMKLF